MNNSTPSHEASTEPLLRSPVRATPPRVAFQIRNRTETEEAAESSASDPVVLVDEANVNNVDARPTPIEREEELELEHCKVLGRAYAAEGTFWFPSIPFTALLGAALGLSTALLFASFRGAFGLWHHVPDGKDLPDWKIHLGMTTLGGFVSGLLFLLPGAPPLGAVRTFVHTTSRLQGQTQQSVLLVLAGMVALTTGAPVGPEQVAHGLAGLGSNLLRVPRRCQALWMQSALAASFGSLFSSPLVGPVLVQELSIMTRPDRMTLDAVVRHEQDQQVEDDAFVTLEDSETDGIGSSLRPDEQDYLESLMHMVIATTMAWVTLRWSYPSIEKWGDLEPVSNEFETWHLAVAVPLGVLCGTIASIVWALQCFTCRIRMNASERMHRAGIPIWFTSLFFPALAGLLHGLLARACPYEMGSGWELLRVTWNGALRDKTFVLSVRELMLTAVTRIVGVASTTGFGMVGGSVFPTAVIGHCVGLAIVSSMPFLPISLVVPCCLVACPAAFCPAPLTAVLAVCFMLQCSAEQTGPLLIASVVAFTITGGTGILRRIGERRLAEGDGVGLMEETDALQQSTRSDDEILQDVRSTIFGSSNA